MDKTVVESHRLRRISLVGNPNSGKTSLFNVLTGQNRKVGNYSGVTVEESSADFAVSPKLTARLTDLPGVDSLYPSSADEAVTCNILKDPSHPDHPDLVIAVVDGTQLKRGLLLCTQVMDLGIPCILAVNMLDLLESEGSILDIAKLGSWLGIQAVGISTRSQKGIQNLRKVLAQPIPAPAKPFMQIPAGFLPALERIAEHIGIQNKYLAFQALLEPKTVPNLDPEQAINFQEMAHIQVEDTDQLLTNELLVRLDRIESILEEAWVRKPEHTDKFTTFIDQLLTHRIWGYIIFSGILFFIFQAIFSWASYPMDWIDAQIGSLNEFTKEALPSGWLTDLIADGIITGFGAIVIFIPQIAFLFGFIAIMEETGYMARVVFLMDRIMRPFGFSGKSIIPLIGGMACAVPSIMMTRSIANRTERFITVMVTPLMSCSARIPVYILLIALLVPDEQILGFNQRGLIMTGLYALGFLMALLVAYILKTLLKYKADEIFIMELPIYRIPKWKNVFRTVWAKSLDFVVGAGTMILLVSVLLWFLVSYGPGDKMEQLADQFEDRLEQVDPNSSEKEEILREYNSQRLELSYAAHLGKIIEPAIKPLGYDWKIGLSLVTSFAAREVFVSTLTIIYHPKNISDDEGEEYQLVRHLSQLKKPNGELVYTPAVALSLIIFYAFAMQCMSTLAVTQREQGWAAAGLMLAYLTALAYIAAWITYLIFS